MIKLSHLDELRDYVRRTLCERHCLDPDEYTMSEHVLVRRGRPAGMYFCQYGPRMMQAHAVWDAERSVLAFYDSAGVRFLKEHIWAGQELLSEIRSYERPQRRAA